MKTLNDLKKLYKELERDEKYKLNGGTQQKSVVIWCRMALTYVPCE
ncbi:hypothetical protein [uncultured Aquimarina sp.]|nr:hypothetical protein [uncultured Aquimarina sp.]